MVRSVGTLLSMGITQESPIFGALNGSAPAFEYGWGGSEGLYALGAADGVSGPEGVGCPVDAGDEFEFAPEQEGENGEGEDCERSGCSGDLHVLPIGLLASVGRGSASREASRTISDSKKASDSLSSVICLRMPGIACLQLSRYR